MLSDTRTGQAITREGQAYERKHRALLQRDAARAEVENLTHAIQRLTRENHTLREANLAVHQTVLDLHAKLGAAESGVLHARDCTRNRERTIYETERRVADERARRQAAEAALQALSASKIRWGTLALGWTIGAATVLLWAFW